MAGAREHYDALGEEFDLARTLIKARTAAGLSQSQLAKRMNTSQSYIARIDGGKVRPSTDALERFAQARARVFESFSNRSRRADSSVGAFAWSRSVRFLSAVAPQTTARC